MCLRKDSHRQEIGDNLGVFADGFCLTQHPTSPRDLPDSNIQGIIKISDQDVKALYEHLRYDADDVRAMQGVLKLPLKERMRLVLPKQTSSSVSHDSTAERRNVPEASSTAKLASCSPGPLSRGEMLKNAWCFIAFYAAVKLRQYLNLLQL